MIANFSKPLIASLALVLAGSTSVFAADAQAFAERLQAITVKTGAPMSFTGAESTGDNVVLKGVKLGSGPDASSVGDITFENVTGSTAEGWSVERVPFADFKQTEQGKEASVSGMVVEGLQLAGAEGASKLPGEAQYFFDSASIGSVKVSGDGKELFSLSGTDITNSVTAGSGEIASSFTLGDFVIDFASMPADETTKTMQALGYSKLSGNGSTDTSWDPKTGELSLNPMELTIEDAGKLSFAFQLNGYTAAFSKSLQQIQQQMATDPAGADNSGMAVIGLVSQLSIASMQLDFTDDSLTNKLLDYYAKQNGQTKEQLIDGISGMMPAVLASLQNPEFQTEVTTAVAAFLKDPKSLTISVDPDAPVAVTQIMGAAMGAPQTLPTVLSLGVVANGVDE